MYPRSDLGAPTEVPIGTGSGVVVDRLGRVLSNPHVIAGARSVVVVGYDGESRQAQVVDSRGRDDFANHVLSAMRLQFGGHAEQTADR